MGAGIKYTRGQLLQGGWVGRSRATFSYVMQEGYIGTPSITKLARACRVVARAIAPSASGRGSLPRGLAQADPGPSVLGPEPCLGRLRAVGGLMTLGRFACIAPHCMYAQLCNEDPVHV
jgi:hypothetical protein